MLQLDIQRACGDSLPDADALQRWVEAALGQAGHAGDAEISLRLVDEAEMAALNARYRGRAGPTNVLSFPCDLPEALNLPLLGDVVICAPVVRREALEQGKSERAHWAHMAVHGTLHLLGYDHVDSVDAEVMEGLETSILEALAFPCPYGNGPMRERAAG
jgi:probable rRNA maturation factor